MSLYKATGDTQDTTMSRLYDKIAALKEENERLQAENKELQESLNFSRGFDKEKREHRQDLGW